MDDIFDDKETKELLIQIQKLCDKLNWTFRTIAIDDEEGGLGGFIMGIEEIVTDILDGDTPSGYDEILH